MKTPAELITALARKIGTRHFVTQINTFNPNDLQVDIECALRDGLLVQAIHASCIEVNGVRHGFFLSRGAHVFLLIDENTGQRAALFHLGFKGDAEYYLKNLMELLE